ncbi:hypothetical protein Ccr34_gp078 [Caulobacter phage Ccr34]|uniref:PE-PGRS family protein n=1 Tax=Caulobacter phage Ccr34 TaxID=1959739 RepID=A0A1V0EF91_9CAUD|nr:hypothetical protein Ccr34_gp078 [Caulobacter phage Ccr34]
MGRSLRGSGTTVTAGGAGGWPDGGYGGKSTSAWVGLGGGGGSTRLYRNGELIGVAGGGGGATGFYNGGNGGGMVGLASADASSGAGGTQSAGGVAGSGTLAIQSGQGFQGGRGGTTASTAHAYAGGGGGGGLYGGASNGGGSGAHGSGGGGSGYINQNLLYSGRLQAGRIDALGVPFDVAGIRPAGVAEGGTGPTVASTGWGSITPGGNGFAYLSLTSVASATAFPTSGTTTLAYSGARQVYTVTQLSTVDIEMWGGGGGGGFYTSGGASPRYGGAGGYTKFTKVLFPGDIVEIEVGQGGQAPTGVGGNIGGFGGWPNGGDGGRSSVNSATNFGGGGGSTNIYVNGRLLGVASGGGGATGFYNGGNGGGKWGLADAAAASGTAGTWACDNSTSTGLARGFFLRGGHGSPNESRDVAHPNAGAGGGGGYWGGGGARGGSGTHGAGGGGCGFINGDLTWNRDYQWGTQGTGQPYTGGAYAAGVGVGGTCGNTAGTTSNGGDGQIVFTVTAASTATLPTDKNALTYTGAVQHYVAPSAGVIDLAPRARPVVAAAVAARWSPSCRSRRGTSSPSPWGKVVAARSMPTPSHPEAGPTAAIRVPRPRPVVAAPACSMSMASLSRSLAPARAPVSPTAGSPVVRLRAIPATLTSPPTAAPRPRRAGAPRACSKAPPMAPTCWPATARSMASLPTTSTSTQAAAAAAAIMAAAATPLTPAAIGAATVARATSIPNIPVRSLARRARLPPTTPILTMSPASVSPVSARRPITTLSPMAVTVRSSSPTKSRPIWSKA